MGVVGIIPAAGYATRLQPLPCSKEVLEVGGRPVVDYVIDRLEQASCEEIRVVTRPEKTDVIAHVRGRNATLVLGAPRTSSASFALGLEGLAPDDIVLLGWPDILWGGEETYVMLAEAVEQGNEVVLGLFETEDDLCRWDTVTVDDEGSVTGIYPKAADPPSTIVWAPAAARRRVLDGIALSDWPGSHFNSLRRRGISILGLRFPGKCTDIGTREDLERARTAPPI